MPTPARPGSKSARACSVVTPARGRAPARGAETDARPPPRVTMKFTNQEFAHILAALQAEERATDAADRRRHSRIDIGIVVQVVDVATGRAYTALTRDISFTGLSIVQ